MSTCLSLQVDEYKHTRDTENRMMELYTMIGGTVELMKPGRSLVHEETFGVQLSHLRPRADKPGGAAVATTPESVALVLFTDMLLLIAPKDGVELCSKQPNSHVILESVDLSTAQLRRCVSHHSTDRRLEDSSLGLL